MKSHQILKSFDELTAERLELHDASRFSAMNSEPPDMSLKHRGSLAENKAKNTNFSRFREEINSGFYAWNHGGLNE
jgi:hypothetical protein